MRCEHLKHGEIWRHFKENHLYSIETVAEHTERASCSSSIRHSTERTASMPARHHVHERGRPHEIPRRRTGISLRESADVIWENGGYYMK